VCIPFVREENVVFYALTPENEACSNDEGNAGNFVFYDGYDLVRTKAKGLWSFHFVLVRTDASIGTSAIAKMMRQLDSTKQCGNPMSECALKE